MTFKGCDRGVNMWDMLRSGPLMWHWAWAVRLLLKRICFFTAQLLQLAAHMTISVFYGRAGSASPELFLTSFHFALVLCQWSSLQFTISEWRMEQDRGLSRKWQVGSTQPVRHHLHCGHLNAWILKSVCSNRSPAKTERQPFPQIQL